MIRLLSTVLLVLALVNIIAAAIPDQVTDNINGAVIYFLNYLNYLAPFIHVSTLFAAIKIVSNFIFYSALYLMILWIIRHATL